MNKKIMILAVLAVIAAVIWLPKLNLSKVGGKKKASGYSGFFNPMPGQKKARKRTAYKDWGKNPFSVSKSAIAIPVIPRDGLRLGGIIYDANDVCALINDEVVHSGDSVDGKKVVEIRPDRVILSDGVKDIELRLEE